MAYGLKIYGQHGILQIDNTYENLTLGVKREITLKGGNDGSPSWGETGASTSINADWSTDISFFAYTSTTWMKRGNKSIFQPLNQSAGKCVLYGFGTNKVEWFPSPYGILVKNQAGNAVFKSTWAICRVIDVFNLSFTEYWSYNVPSGKTYAIAFGGGRDQYNAVNDEMEGYSHYFRTAGSKIEISYLVGSWWFRDNDEQSYTAKEFPLSIIIIDVTNY
ncbi:hypothetical protein [Arsenophonus nasoniae]|uniref:Uncharacterized protein n=1 Tax=Arsenophonus nasoniae TaxID=638 RepID=A0AA95KC39_9GAMM|nr:hypothetical protein [Arsenophonus nasoniae]WGL99992.1 hypothetical protein QE210_08735 [Arsenophonus nasoniae]WGM00344.1 hypothetical protein QE210_10690 [Arsenophonus nasoniae]WGM01891.1 hypothetical protein QE210_01815 [Arsenophonus nasoniae]